MQKFIKGECGGPELSQSCLDVIKLENNKVIIKLSNTLLKKYWRKLKKI